MVYPNPHQHRTHAVGIFQLSFVVFEKSGNNILTYIHTDRQTQPKYYIRQLQILDSCPSYPKHDLTSTSFQIQLYFYTRGCPFKFERRKFITPEIHDANFTIVFLFVLFCFVFNSAIPNSVIVYRFFCSIVCRFDGPSRLLSCFNLFFLCDCYFLNV